MGLNYRLRRTRERQHTICISSTMHCIGVQQQKMSHIHSLHSLGSRQHAKATPVACNGRRDEHPQTGRSARGGYRLPMTHISKRTNFVWLAVTELEVELSLIIIHLKCPAKQKDHHQFETCRPFLVHL